MTIKDGDDRKSQVREPVQARAKETRSRIIAAAADVFGDVGYDKATTHAIAERAGVSVGSLYAYFADKDALLTELFDQHAAELFSFIEAPFSQIDTEDFDPRLAIRAAVEASVRAHEINPGLHRVFHALADHPAIAPFWQRWKQAALVRIQALLEQGGDHVKVGNLETAAFIIYHTVDAVCVRYLLHGEGPDAGTETLIDELTSMFLRYLTGLEGSGL